MDDTTSHGPPSEPADPPRVDHDQRLSTRIAPPTFDVSRLPKPLIECGCGDCPAAADPLADDSEVWRDTLWAATCCPTPQPMTVKRAAKAYRVYQTASFNASGRTSRFEEIRDQHGHIMDAERDLLDRWDGEVTTVLLSFRLSPIETADRQPHAIEGDEVGADLNGAGYELTVGSPSGSGCGSSREWVPPVQLDGRLHDPWRNIYDCISHHLGDYDWEYVGVVAPTESAATPHLHLYLWVRDAKDTITVDHVRPAVESFVRNAVGAKAKHHSVEQGESDAAVIRHSPRPLSMNDTQRRRVARYRGEEDFKQNTRGLAYVMHQRPHWALRPLVDDSCRDTVDSVRLQGAAISWASPHRWFFSSQGLK